MAIACKKSGEGLPACRACSSRRLVHTAGVVGWFVSRGRDFWWRFGRNMSKAKCWPGLLSVLALFALLAAGRRRQALAN